MPQLLHLIYASGATRDLTRADLASILSASQRNNTRENISGMLLYSAGSFFQVLEGDSAAVHAAFERIEKDPRHTNITSIINEPIASRSFEDWSMGYAELSDEEANAIVGRNDFFAARNCLMSLNRGRARKLLEAFAHGRWHTTTKLATTVSETPAFEPR